MESFSNLLPTSSLPSDYHAIFCNIAYFNHIQSQVFPKIFDSNKSLVISAPTGSGKTVIFELAIVNLLKTIESGEKFKIIYVAPMKALCDERHCDWDRKFSSYNIRSISFTGDSRLTSLHELAEFQLIITTPEKWDWVTRYWRSHLDIIKTIKLFMIDEVHLLGEEKRGPTLEVVISRIKTMQQENPNYSIRFVAASASIPNVKDIADWMNSAIDFSFGDELRPIQLNKIIIGYPINGSTFKFDMWLNYKLPDLILQHSNNKPCLIFCTTRKAVEMAAKHLSQKLTLNVGNDRREILRQAGQRMIFASCREFLVHGVGFHHAGMLPDDRGIVEDLFRKGLLPVLVSTGTLAMGVNLPAHLVIVKSTKYYVGGEYRDYNETMLMQMIGRAGRPQFDTSGTAIILTTVNDRERYENMVKGQLIVESSLHRQLVEHINSEIALGTIKDLVGALNWVRSTFLHRRARKNPKYYGISPMLKPNQIDRKLLEMCQIEINKLLGAEMVELDQNGWFTSTRLGRLMAKYCLQLGTMKLFKEIQQIEGSSQMLPQLLNLISKCQEFADQFLRVSDKRTLNVLNICKNTETIRFPLNGRIKTAEMKINCLIQAVFGSLQIIDPSLLNDAQRIMQVGERVSKCLLDYLESSEKSYFTLLNTTILAKCFRARIWENSKYVARQLHRLGAVYTKALVDAGKTSFSILLETNPRHLELILNKRPPAGDNIIRMVRLLPRYEMRMQELKDGAQSRLLITINLMNAEEINEEVLVDPESVMTLIVGDQNNNLLYFKKYKHIEMITNPRVCIELAHIFTVETNISAHFISDHWAGIDCNESLCLFKSRNPHLLKPSGKNVQKKSTNKPRKCFAESIKNFFEVINKEKEQPKPSTNKAANLDSKKQQEIDEQLLLEIEDDYIYDKLKQQKFDSQDYKRKSPKIIQSSPSVPNKEKPALNFNDVIDDSVLQKIVDDNWTPQGNKTEMQTTSKEEHNKDVMNMRKEIIQLEEEERALLELDDDEWISELNNPGAKKDNNEISLTLEEQLLLLEDDFEEAENVTINASTPNSNSAYTMDYNNVSNDKSIDGNLTVSSKKENITEIEPNKMSNNKMNDDYPKKRKFLMIDEGSTSAINTRKTDYNKKSSNDKTINDNLPFNSKQQNVLSGHTSTNKPELDHNKVSNTKIIDDHLSTNSEIKNVIKNTQSSRYTFTLPTLNMECTKVSNDKKMDDNSDNRKIIVTNSTTVKTAKKDCDNKIVNDNLVKDYLTLGPEGRKIVDNILREKNYKKVNILSDIALRGNDTQPKVVHIKKNYDSLSENSNNTNYNMGGELSEPSNKFNDAVSISSKINLFEPSNKSYDTAPNNNKTNNQSVRSYKIVNDQSPNDIYQSNLTNSLLNDSQESLFGESSKKEETPTVSLEDKENQAWERARDLLDEKLFKPVSKKEMRQQFLKIAAAQYPARQSKVTKRQISQPKTSTSKWSKFINENFPNKRKPKEDNLQQSVSSGLSLKHKTPTPSILQSFTRPRLPQIPKLPYSQQPEPSAMRFERMLHDDTPTSAQSFIRLPPREIPRLDEDCYQPYSHQPEPSTERFEHMLHDIQTPTSSFTRSRSMQITHLDEDCYQPYLQQPEPSTGRFEHMLHDNSTPTPSFTRLRRTQMPQFEEDCYQPYAQQPERFEYMLHDIQTPTPSYSRSRPTEFPWLGDDCYQPSVTPSNHKKCLSWSNPLVQTQSYQCERDSPNRFNFSTDFNLSPNMRQKEVKYIKETDLSSYLNKCGNYGGSKVSSFKFNVPSKPRTSIFETEEDQNFLMDLPNDDVNQLHFAPTQEYNSSNDYRSNMLDANLFSSQRNPFHDSDKDNNDFSLKFQTSRDF